MVYARYNELVHPAGFILEGKGVSISHWPSLDAEMIGEGHHSWSKWPVFQLGASFFELSPWTMSMEFSHHHVNHRASKSSWKLLDIIKYH